MEVKTVVLIVIIGIIAFFSLKSVFKVFCGKGGCSCGNHGESKSGCGCSDDGKQKEKNEDHDCCCGNHK